MKDFFKKIFFETSALSWTIGGMAIIGGASMIGDIPVYKAAILSGVAAVAQVLQKLAIAFADDGILSKEELDSAFNGSSNE